MTTWINRGDDAPLVWEDRSPSSTRSNIFGGNYSFNVVDMSGVTFWHPRFIGYGGSYAGLDVWQERTSGSQLWSER